MSKPAAVILAAGQGTRMVSALPKVLHPLCGRPLLLWPVTAARAAGIEQITVVASPQAPLDQYLPDDVGTVIQPESDGTGGALRAALPELAKLSEGTPVIVLAGDVPLVTVDDITRLINAYSESGAAATVATMVLDDPSGYGRVVRGADGNVERVVETKKPGDATPQQLEIKEVNSGIYVLRSDLIAAALDRITTDNAQAEYYLPDLLPALAAQGHLITACELPDPTSVLGINSRSDLATVTGYAQRRIHQLHMANGVTIVNPQATTIDVDVSIGADTVIEPFTALLGKTEIGANCVIGSFSTLRDAQLANDITVVSSHLDNCQLEEAARVGPFAYLRPGAYLHEGAKAGTFVEIKNSEIGAGTKIPHLSYIGDADIGEQSNLGAGTITANYDGRAKHRTKIGSNVRGGVDTALVAPVSIGDNAWTAAGSVITDDVPSDALAVARSRQVNVEEYATRKNQKPAKK